MSQGQKTASIHANIEEYKRKYYLNQVVRGTVLSLIIIMTYVAIVLLSESFFWFSSSIRTAIFFVSLVLFLTVLFRFILFPLLHLYLKKIQISNEKAARQIGSFLPEVGDRLVNILQLENMSESNALAAASIEKKTPSFKNISFGNSIDITKNLRFTKYLLIPIGIVSCIWILYPKTITGSTERIISFQKEFQKEAPFQFIVDQEDDFNVFRNDQLRINMQIQGLYIPEDVYIEIEGREILLRQNEQTLSYQYTFNGLTIDQSFRFRAAGYTSKTYHIRIIERPILKGFSIEVDYPKYTGLEDKTFNSLSQMILPEGTKTHWRFFTTFADSARVKVHQSNHLLASKSGVFSYQRKVLSDFDLELELKNQFGINKEKIEFQIKTIDDLYPEIDLYQIKDTILYQSILLGGKLTDDYGIRRLSVHHKISGASDFQEIKIPLASYSNNVSFVHDWQLADLGFIQGQQIDYFLQVWDNDQVNGSKSTKTSIFQFRMPDKTEIREQINKEASQTTQSTQEAKKQTEDISQEIKEISDEIKSKQKLEWQDKKRIEELIQEKEQLEEQLKKLSEEHKKQMDKRQQFNKYDENIKDKYEQLQELMDQLLDEETKKLYEDLEKLLQENSKIENMKEMLDKLQNKEQNLSKELERSLELFKQMQIDMKMEDIKNDLNDLSLQQEQLADQTIKEELPNQELQNKQQEINDQYEDIQTNLDELDSLNQKLKNKRDLEDFDQSDKGIEESLEKSKQELQKQNNSGANQQQKKAARKMKKMSQKMADSQVSAEMEMLNENISDLKNLLDNLLRLSHEQEDIMVKMRNVREVDPTFVDLSQRQLRLQGNTQIVKDSLYALAERVVQLNSFVTKEVAKLDQNMQSTITEMRQRLIPNTAARQQLTMTSMNNLALLLDGLLKSLMSQMNAMSGAGKGGEKDSEGSDNKGGQMPNMSQLQKQLNQKIQQLKQGQKSGRQLSEGLAKMAAEQERLRRMLQEMRQYMDNGDKGKAGKQALDNLAKEMEKTEEDLVNKRLNNQLIQRQNRIQTRLLEAETAMRERELDKKREAESAQQREKAVPPAFEEYFKQKEREIELLKTVPLKLNPFYKKEVEQYFDRLGKSENQ